MALKKKADAATPARRDSCAVHMRVTPEEEALLKQAADLERRSLGNFCAIASIKAAKQALKEHGEELPQ